MSLLIWFTWLPWVGKWILINYLSDQFDSVVFSTSDVLREYLKENNIELNRKNLRDRANFLRNNFWAWILAQKVINKIKFHKNQNLFFIDWIRNPSEVLEFKNTYPDDFVLIWIDSNIDLLVDRIVERWREWEKDREKIKNNIIKEKKWIWWKSSQRPYDCVKMADYLIDNNSDKETFLSKWKNIVENILKKL